MRLLLESGYETTVGVWAYIRLLLESGHETTVGVWAYIRLLLESGYETRSDSGAIPSTLLRWSP